MSKDSIAISKAKPLNNLLNVFIFPSDVGSLASSNDTSRRGCGRHLYFRTVGADSENFY